MPAIIAAIVAWFGEMLSSSVVQFIAFKILLTTLFVIVLPLVLQNLFCKILEIFHNKMLATIGDPQATIVQLSGLAAFFAEHLQLPLVISILLGAVATRTSLKLMRLI